MTEKKGSTVLLTVIGIATLLVTLVGATYAYFTAEINEVDAGDNDVVITAANLGTIVYDHTDTVSLDNVYPGATDSIDFSVTAANGATSSVNYDVYLIVTANTFTTTNLVATLTAPEGDNFSSSLSSTALDSTTYGATKEVKIGSGVVAPNATDSWNLSVLLKEMNAEQNDDQGKQFTARIEVRVEGQGQYTQESVYGTN